VMGGWHGQRCSIWKEAWYHVCNRGIERRPIFKSSKCYSHFVELLSQLSIRFGVQLHGRVLMANQATIEVG
jgi:hypothetical protein